MEFSDGTLPNLLNLNFKEKQFDHTKVKSSSLTALLFKSLEELQKCCQKNQRGQTDEPKRLPYVYILKTVLKVL